MRVIAFNGSPRPDGVTATLLKKALEGAASKGATTEFVHLNSIRMRDCQGCYSCKLRGGPSYGRCVLKDGMTPLYAKIESAGGILLGSPVYFGSVTALAKLFIDRLFAYASYPDHRGVLPRKIRVGLIFTASAPPALLDLFRPYVQFCDKVFDNLLGPTEQMWSADTFGVADPTKYADSMEAQVERKLKHRREAFPVDCQKAFEMGARFAM